MRASVSNGAPFVLRCLHSTLLLLFMCACLGYAHRSTIERRTVLRKRDRALPECAHLNWCACWLSIFVSSVSHHNYHFKLPDIPISGNTVKSVCSHGCRNLCVQLQRLWYRNRHVREIRLIFLCMTEDSSITWVAHYSWSSSFGWRAHRQTSVLLLGGRPNRI